MSAAQSTTDSHILHAAAPRELVTPWFAFRSASIQDAYREYRVRDVSYHVLALALILGSIMQSYFASQVASAQHFYLLCFTRVLRIVI